jgi:DNA-binding PadR family transcriptional regulator
MTTDRMLTDVEFQLLALTVEERTGRDVAKEYERITRSTISYGTLYPTLRRLADSGWVKSRDEITERGRVKWFRITGEGRRVLAAARERYGLLMAFGAGGGA